MKFNHIPTLCLLSLAGLLPSGGYFTANAKADAPTPDAATNPPPDTLAELQAKFALQQKQIEAQAQQITEMKVIAANARPAGVEPVLSSLGLMAKGAGVPLSDVIWRVQAGVEPEQAVQAALAQKQFNESDEGKKLFARNARIKAAIVKADADVLAALAKS